MLDYSIDTVYIRGTSRRRPTKAESSALVKSIKIFQSKDLERCCLISSDQSCFYFILYMETGEHYNIFVLFLISLFYLQFDCDVLVWGFFCFNYVWCSLSFMDFWAYSFDQIWKNFCFYFFKYFFCSSSPLSYWDFSYMYVRLLDFVL